MINQTNYVQYVKHEASRIEPEYTHLTQPGTMNRYIHTDLFGDPALVASCILLSLTLRNPPSREIAPMLRLRGHVIRSINEALDDPSRATSDYVISAVSLLAMYEAYHGFRESYPVHMFGLMRMINHRGGFKQLGFEGGLAAWSKSISPQSAPEKVRGDRRGVPC